MVICAKGSRRQKSDVAISYWRMNNVSLCGGVLQRKRCVWFRVTSNVCSRFWEWLLMILYDSDHSVATQGGSDEVMGNEGIFNF